MIIETEQDVTKAVLGEIARAPNPRFREIMTAFVRHLHGFAREVKLTEEESGRLLKMEDELHKNVIGQEEAVKALSRAIRRTRAGLKDPRRPGGSSSTPRRSCGTAIRRCRSTSSRWSAPSRDPISPPGTR